MSRRSALELAVYLTKRSRTKSNPKELRTLEDAGLALQPADIASDLLDVGRSDTVDLRHIAELPMVGFDSEGGGALKRRVPVMVGFINLMNERRALLRPGALWTMAGETMGMKFGFSRLKLHRDRGSSDGGFGL